MVMSIPVARIINAAKISQEKGGLLKIEFSLDVDIIDYAALWRLHLALIGHDGKECCQLRCTDAATVIGARHMLIPVAIKCPAAELFGFDHGVRSKRFEL